MRTVSSPEPVTATGRPSSTVHATASTASVCPVIGWPLPSPRAWPHAPSTGGPWSPPSEDICRQLRGSSLSMWVREELIIELAEVAAEATSEEARWRRLE
ncbi:hypothetical protein GCM10022226_62580 [Sphaerisporangium flaviroseum]|uniref:Transposase n=1 Tax=Sphaerisporangium flaviroseum TaxID=509199 RepID=A0ABP7J360_9ACTN